MGFSQGFLDRDTRPQSKQVIGPGLLNEGEAVSSLTPAPGSWLLSALLRAGSAEQTGLRAEQVEGWPELSASGTEEVRRGMPTLRR